MYTDNIQAYTKKNFIIMRFITRPNIHCILYFYFIFNNL